MAYTAAEQIRLPRIYAEHTGDAVSTTTFGRLASVSVAGAFTASVKVETKTYGDDDTEGQWVESGVVTGPGDFTLKLTQNRPMRYSVEDYVSGTVYVSMELATPHVDAFQLG